MGKSVLIIGPSGAGKTTSIGQIDELEIEGLDPTKTIVISALGKELPWRGSEKQYTIYNKESNPKGNMVITSNPRNVLQWLHHVNQKMPHITTVVIDDNTHNSSMEYMRRINEKSYEKFNDIADFMSRTALDVKTFRDDLTVFFLHHTRETGDGIVDEKQTSAMTIGKLVDEKLSGYESFFTVVLKAVKRTKDDTIEYGFLTKDANSTVKTPIGMFADTLIKNDLGFVRKTLNCYYSDDCADEGKESKTKK